MEMLLASSSGIWTFNSTTSLFVTEQKGRFKDSYVMGERLGNGAFGEVRQCINRVTGHVRAVKIILKSNIDSFDTKKLVH